jgi:hypothetical protein
LVAIKACLEDWDEDTNADSSSMNYSPRDLILYEKEEGVKFDKDTIIICETMNG